MRLFVLAVGDRARASSRLRIWDHENWMREQFQSVAVDYLLDSSANRLTVRGLLRMFWRTPRWIVQFLRADVILFQETLWLAALIPLRKLGKSRRLVFDFSDPVDLIGHGFINRLRRRAFQRMTRDADAVMCENPLYFDELSAKRAAVHRQVGPVDSSRYQRHRSPDPGGMPLNIGWTGSSATFDFIKPLLDILDEIAGQRSIQLTLIGVKTTGFKPRHLKVRELGWSEELEFVEVPRFDLGLFALDRSPKSLRRGAGKLFIYMGAGVPFIATNVGIGADTMKRHDLGFAVDDDGQWRAGLLAAIDSADARATYSARGMQVAAQEFSYESYREKLGSILAGA